MNASNRSPIAIPSDLTKLFTERFLAKASFRWAEMTAFDMPSTSIERRLGELYAFSQLTVMLCINKTSETANVTPDGVLIPDFTGTLAPKQVEDLNQSAKGQSPVAGASAVFNAGFQETSMWMCEMLDIPA